MSTVADQLDALRRVALLTARGADSAAVLDAIVEEAFGLFDVDFTALLKYEADGAASIIALHHGPPSLSIGERAPHLSDGLVLRVFHSLRPVRVEAYADVPGPEVARMHELGIVAGAAAPVLIGGRLWGVLTAMTRSGPVVADVERRLADFAEIAATAIAGAKTRDERRELADLRQIAEEHAALRRVAELVARGTGEQQLFDCVTDEAAALIGDEATTLVRFTGERAFTILATHGGPAAVGSTVVVPHDDAGVVAEVLRTKLSARLDDYGTKAGPLYAQRDFGVRSSVAVPIMVEDRMWGMLGVVTTGHQLPGDTERRLQQFTELTGTAISAAHVRRELRSLADEQAALRRVAELVAHGAALDQVFNAVTAETSKLFAGMPATLRRYDPDGTATTVAATETDAGAMSELPTTVTAPIEVEGHVWGELTTNTSGSTPLDGDEGRLRHFAELASAAIANAYNKAQLTASRARVVATADETRRRLQRDVHDGAQQRLVQTIITLKVARDAAGNGDVVDERVIEALDHAERANSELRDLVHGILPASLTQGGLRIGLESLISDITIPVHLRLTAPRLPTQIETTAYFIAAEALTNVVKHAGATHADVTVHLDGAALMIEVCDDGIGGADPSGGTGLTGLSDRVEAADGVLTITSAAGSGTTVHVSIPLADQPP